jgi:hypothetical protein
MDVGRGSRFGGVKAVRTLVLLEVRQAGIIMRLRIIRNNIMRGGVIFSARQDWGPAQAWGNAGGQQGKVPFSTYLGLPGLIGGERKVS